MIEKFNNLCKLLHKSSLKFKTFDITLKYDENEIFYLAISKKLENIDSYREIKVKEIRDDSYLNKNTLNNKTIGNISFDQEMNLEMPQYKSTYYVNYTKPELFEGYLKISGFIIPLETRRSTFTLINNDRKFRYCVNKPPPTITKIKLNELKGFGNIINSSNKIKYRRNLDDILKNLVFYPLHLPSTIASLYFLELSLTDFIIEKIKIFLNNQISSKNLLNDLIFAIKCEKMKIIDITPLILHIENIIATCKCDDFCYKLFCYLGFLLKIKKVTVNMNNKEHINNLENSLLDPKFNFPIIKSKTIPIFLYNRLSEKILRFITENKPNTLQVLQFYRRLDIKLNNIFIEKYFSISTDKDSLIDGILKMNLSENINNYENLIKKISISFSNELNDILKDKNDVSNIYSQLFKNFYIFYEHSKFFDQLFKSISKVHIKRISKSIDIEELKAIHKSMIICEKTYGKRDENVENLLKKKALKLLKIK